LWRCITVKVVIWWMLWVLGTMMMIWISSRGEEWEKRSERMKREGGLR
jgi:hypothetical protein